MEYRKIIDVEFREFDRRTLEKTREWLSDPQIKELTITPDFDEKSQETWFQSIQNKDNYYIRSVWRGDDPIAVFGIKHITATDGEIWGYIGEKQYWGKAIGIEMMHHVFDYARSLNLKSLYAIMLKENIYSVKILRRFGYGEETELDGERMMMRYYL